MKTLLRFLGLAVLLLNAVVSKADPIDWSSGFSDRYAVHIRNAANSDSCLNHQTYTWESNNNIYTCNNHPDQVWDIKTIENGYFRIRHTKYDVCLNVQDSYDYKETNVYGCNVHPDQEWIVRNVGNGYIQIESRRAPGKCLSTNQVYLEAHTVIKSCNGSDYTQLWSVY